MASELGGNRASYESVTSAAPGEENSSRGSSFRRVSGAETPNNGGGYQAWWEGIARARKSIDALALILPLKETTEYLKDSERPARRLLESCEVSRAVKTYLAAPNAGIATDALCQWLYDTFLTNDSDLQLVVLRFLPLLAGIYLSRLVSDTNVAEPLAGFEAVLLAVYTAEAKVRSGKPLLVHVPDLSEPSLYHSPRKSSSTSAKSVSAGVGQLCGALEPQMAVKSTKRAAIVGVCFDVFYRKISEMPARAKLELCRYVQAWAGQDCSCLYSLDQDEQLHSLDQDQQCSPIIGHESSETIKEDTGNEDSVKCVGGYDDAASVNGNHNGSFQCPDEGNSRALVVSSKRGDSGLCFDNEDFSAPHGARIPLPWELLRPILRILGHCLFSPLIPQELRDTAALAARSLYARASHDLVPEAILATRSLVRLRIFAQRPAPPIVAASSDSNGSNATTPAKSKPEVFLASK